jgi:hypothetical protein
VRRAGNAGADRGYESIEPARHENDTSVAAKTGPGFSNCSVIDQAAAADRYDRARERPRGRAESMLDYVLGEPVAVQAAVFFSAAALLQDT